MDDSNVGYVKIDDVLSLEDSKPIPEIIAAEIDRAISKDIVEVLRKYFPNTIINEEKVTRLARIIVEEVPSADVAKSEDTVEVIRCRNCKHWDKDNIQKYTYSSDDSTLVDFAECFRWSCWSTCHKTRYNDYCSLAEKYTEEEK